MKNNLLKKISIITLTLAIALTTFVGCGSSKKGSVGENGTINVLNWGDYIDEQVIKDFEKETLIKVVYNTYDTNEAMYTKIKTSPGTYDIVIPSDYMISKMVEENMLEEIDFNNIPNYKHIGDQYKNLDYDPENKYSVPYTWGVIGLIYDADVVTEKVDSWDILWNEKYKGDILMYDSVRDIFVPALKKLGYSLNTTNPQEIEAAKNLLITQVPLVKSLVVDEIKPLLVNGEASLAPVWSGDAVYIMNEAPDKNFKFVIPKEGSNKYFDSVAIPKDAPNKKAAEQFINYISEPENAKSISDYIGYSSANTGAFDLMDEETQNNEVLYPKEAILKESEIFKALPQDALRIYNDAFTEIKSKF